MTNIYIPSALVLGCNTPHGIGVLSDYIEEQTGHAPEFHQSGWDDGDSGYYQINFDRGCGYCYGHGVTGLGCGDGVYQYGYLSGDGDGCGAYFYYGDGDGCGVIFYGTLAGNGRSYSFYEDYILLVNQN